jgi:two-component system sensor histidine kinase EvgS
MRILHTFLFSFLLATLYTGVSAVPAKAQDPVLGGGVILTAEEKAWLAAHSDITFGFTDSFEPFLIKGERGKHTGILVEFLKKLNSQLGTQFALEVDSWPVIIGKVKNKEMGAVLGVAFHTAEAFGLLKTVPYYTVYPAFFTREDAQFSINSLDNLRGKSVAILDSAKVMENILKPYESDIDLLHYPDNRTAFRSVFEGKVDVAFGLTIHEYAINKYGMFGVKPAYTLLERPSKVGMAVRTDWPELVSILDKWITSFSQEEIDTLIRRWIDIPDTGTAIELSDEEKDWLALNRTVRVRIADYPPYQIVRDNESVEGIVVEYLKYIEDRIGIQFEYEVTDQPFAEFLDDMRQNRGPDMTAIITPTPERENYISFSEPYIYSPYVIFVQEEAKPIFDISGLTGKLLAVPRGFVVQEQLARDYPDIRLALFDSDEDALHAVATGQADAYIGNLTVASHIIHRRGFSGLQVTAASPFKEQSLSMGNRTDWPEFTSIINKALASIKEDEKTAIRKKYLAIKFEQGIEKALVVKWVSILLGSTLGILAIFLFWNRRLAVATSKRKDAEERLLTTFDNMPIAAVMINNDDSMYLHNKRFLELFGYTLEDIPHLSDWWVKAYPEEEYRKWVIETWNACLQRSIETGENIEAREYKVTCKNGDVRDMEISGHFLGDRYLATLIDNTERNQAKAEIMKAKEAADNANQAKSIFLASMSHELRTPLNAILGFSKLLAQNPKVPADETEKLSIINRSGQHLLSMINDVLDLTKIETGRIDLKEYPFELSALMKEMSVMVESRATEKGLAMYVEDEAISFPCIKADLGKMRQVMINLLSNAIKFTDEGQITIRCMTEAIPDNTDKCVVLIEVEDTGPGIEPDRHESIFEPFVQGHNLSERRGTGLGLSICKQCLEIMGGTIEVDSEVGAGSIFRVCVVAEIVEAADISTPVDDKPRVIGLTPTETSWRILITDDNRENLLLLKSLLEEVGFVVLEAENGEEAVEIFRKESADLVWMDMRMPVMDGYEATRKIRQIPGGDTVPIIAITASAFLEQRDEILAAGCNDMVTKPFQEHEIFEAMARLLDIKYIYARETGIPSDQVDETDLTSTMLSELPTEVLNELLNTCLDLDMEALAHVIERLKVEAPETAKGLKHLADNFQIARIRELIEKL